MSDYHWFIKPVRYVAYLIILFSVFWIGVAFEKWRTGDDVDAIRQGCEKSYQKLFPETKDEDLMEECVDYILTPGQ